MEDSCLLTKKKEPVADDQQGLSEFVRETHWEPPKKPLTYGMSTYPTQTRPFRFRKTNPYLEICDAASEVDQGCGRAAFFRLVVDGDEWECPHPMTNPI